MGFGRKTDDATTDDATCAERAAIHEDAAERAIAGVGRPGGERHAVVAQAHAMLAVNYRLRMAAGEA